MKTRTWIIATAAAGLAVLLTPRVISQDEAAREEAHLLAEPGPEHWLLEQLVGEWEGETDIYRGPGIELASVASASSNKMIAGARFLLCKTRIGSTDEVERTTVLGFDRRRGRYTAVQFESFGTNYVTAEGSWDAEQAEIVLCGEDEDPQLGGLATFQFVLQIEGDDQYTFRILADAPDGTEVQMMKTVFRRKAE